jgi:glycosyltransferase involved in cell wall biosynthesis
MGAMKYSVIIPVYQNEESIARLIDVLSKMEKSLDGQLEVVFVVDGSPDQSYELLKQSIENVDYPVQLLAHSRNFGSFPAIRTGLTAARGKFFAVMAADLQEPPELLLNFFLALVADECDVTIGIRNKRSDPLSSRLASHIFWGIYRKLVVPEMPEGGVDIFGCNQVFRKQLLQLEESRSSLIALIFWLGFRRKFIAYERQSRQEGKSGWTFAKKVDYMLDSIFSFTDFPIRLLTRTGAIGSVLIAIVGIIVLMGRLLGVIEVPGYTAIMIAILFFGALNLLGLGLVGTYAWRSYENSKRRPLAVVALHYHNQRSGNGYS